jgi:hypothetical protein
MTDIHPYVQVLIVEDVSIDDPMGANRQVRNPTWEQIENAIESLDGKDRSTVIIGPLEPEQVFMVIGGGESGRLVCNVFDNGREYAVTDPAKPSDKVVEVLLGQTTVRSFNEIVDLDSPLLAARTYAETGMRDERLTWKEL